MKYLRFGRGAASGEQHSLHEALMYWSSDWQRVDLDLSPNWDRAETLADLTIEGEHMVPRREIGA